jgi:glycosyltransferase involved in cell wall biosynthesis
VDAARPFTVMQLLPALEGGGVERSTLEIAEALVAAGHRSLVVSAGGRLVAALEAGGSTHIARPIGRKGPGVLREIGRLRALIEQHRPDIVHARSRLPAWIARLALRGLRGPRPRWMTTVHGLNSPGRYSAVMTTGERVVCVSASVRDYLRHHYPALDAARLRVIPRGIDPAMYPRGHRPDAPWRAAFDAAWPQLAGRPLLLLPGRGTRLKGHADAVRALALLATRHGIEAGLYMPGAREAGRERYLDEIAALARSLGVATRVVFDEARGDLREVYGIAAAVLQLSFKPEAFGRTALEALSIGVPVVGYAHGGIGELLGELYPAGAVAPGDLDGVVARLARVLREPSVIAPLRGHTLADMQFATLTLYRELLDSPR